MSDIKKTSIVHQILRIVLPICLLAAGVAGYQYYKSKEAKVKRRPPKKQVMQVETVSFLPGNYPARIQVMGSVIPDREVFLKSKVGGEVVFISPKFVRGGVIKKGEVLVRLDDSDYTIEIQKAQSTLEKAQSDLSLELGNQKIAKEEYKLISKVSKNKVVATDLALRKPQLTQARAVVKSAQADLEKARLNLSRTIVRVPFNSLALSKNVDLGSLVSAQESIATLVNTDTFHVEALVPPDLLGVLLIDAHAGSRAVVQSPYSQQTWPARIIRTTGKIASESRMAGVLAAVKDPLNLTSKGTGQPLMLDDYVIVDIEGKMYEDMDCSIFMISGNISWVNLTYRSVPIKVL